MNTHNSPTPKPGKSEIISFILLVVLSAAVVAVWTLEKKIPGNQKNFIETAPAENPVDQNSERFNADTLPSPQAQEVIAPTHWARPVTKAVKKSGSGAAIAPPLPAHNIKSTENIINTAAGELITTEKNTRITIPPYAFVDARGNVVEGNVTVSYREYHSFMDIFLSGIPMESDNVMLESAGMIEINAAQNGEPVYVNPKNKIGVMLASASKEADYNLYFLDQKTMKWKQRDKSEMLLTNAPLSSYTEYIESPQSKVFLDSIERKFYFNRPRYPVEVVCRSDMRARKKFWFSRKHLSYVFDFSISRSQTMPPELKTLSGITWRYYGKDAQEVFMKLFELDKMPKQTVNSKVIVTGYSYVTEDLEAGPNDYQIHFAAGRTNISLSVVPVFRSKWSKNAFERKWKKYSEAYAVAKRNEEIRFSQFQLDTAAYFANNERYVARKVTTETAALRSFEVDNFGIWNCDRPIPDMPSTVIAEFIDEKGNPLEITTGYLVVKSRNTVYTVRDFRNFKFDPKAETLFWAVLPNDKLAIIYPKEFAKNQTTGNRCTFTMQIRDTALDNISSLKSALSFN